MQVGEPPQLMRFDESERLVEPGEDRGGFDVRSRILDYNAKSANLM